MGNRAYQREFVEGAFETLATTKKNVAFALCVSAGKTRISLLTTEKLLKSKVFSHVIVLVPTVSIHDQWVYERVKFDPPIEVNILTRKEFKSTSNRTIQDYLQSEGRSLYVTGYDALRTYFEDIKRILAGDAQHVLIIVDEGHHTHKVGRKNNDISLCLDEFCKWGGRTIKLTGTPHRSDKNPVYDFEDEVFTRSLVDHMLDQCTPERLLSEWLTLPGRATYDKESGEFGAPPEEREREGFALIAQHIVNEGRPKCIIRLKVGSRVTNQRRVKALREELIRQGLTVLLAYSLDPEEGESPAGEKGRETQELLDLIALENGQERYSAEDTQDVIIAFSRIGEGVNLPSRSHVYYWGIPTSMVVFMQLLGRIMRMRLSEGAEPMPLIDNYPEDWLNASKVVLCVAELQSKPTTEHAYFLLGVVAHLAALDNVSLLASLTHIEDGLPLDVRPSQPRDVTKKIAVGLEAAHTVLTLSEAEYELRRSPYDEALTPKTRKMLARDYAVRHGIEINENALRVATLSLIRNRKEVRRRTQARARQNLIEEGMDYMAAVHRTIEEIFEEFENETAICSSNKQLRELDGSKASWFAALLDDVEKQKRPEGLTHIVARFRRYMQEEGRLPPLAEVDRKYAPWRWQDYRLKARKDGTEDGLYAELAGKEWGSDRILRLQNRIKKVVGNHTGEADLRWVYAKLVKGWGKTPEFVYFEFLWRAVYADYSFLSSLTYRDVDLLHRESFVSISTLKQTKEQNEKLFQTKGLEALLEERRGTHAKR